MDESLLVNQHLSVIDKGFVSEFVGGLDALIETITDQRNPELAIECLYHFDQARKKLDHIQAFPWHGARTEIDRYTEGFTALEAT
jgi:hypothetical protein